MSVVSQSHDTLSKDQLIQYGSQVNIEYFVESIRRKPVSTKWTFDKMTLRQKAFSTKWHSRRSVVRRSVVYPIPIPPACLGDTFCFLGDFQSSHRDKPIQSARCTGNTPRCCNGTQSVTIYQRSNFNLNCPRTIKTVKILGLKD